VCTCADVGGLHCLTGVLKKRNLRTFGRRRIATREAAAVTADARSVVEGPSRSRRRICIAADIRRLEATVREPAGGRGRRVEPYVVDERGVIAATADADQCDRMRSARRNRERRRLIRTVRGARWLVRADRHAIDLYAHDLRSDLM